MKELSLPLLILAYSQEANEEIFFLVRRLLAYSSIAKLAPQAHTSSSEIVYRHLLALVLATTHSLGTLTREPSGHSKRNTDYFDTLDNVIHGEEEESDSDSSSRTQKSEAEESVKDKTASKERRQSTRQILWRHPEEEIVFNEDDSELASRGASESSDLTSQDNSSEHEEITDEITKITYSSLVDGEEKDKKEETIEEKLLKLKVFVVEKHRMKKNKMPTLQISKKQPTRRNKIQPLKVLERQTMGSRNKMRRRKC